MTKKLYRIKYKQWAIDRLGGHCVKCGTTEKLEFDHVNPSTKSFTIVAQISASKEKLKAELEKCQLLCNKCHWDKTRIDNNYNQLNHGDVGMYTNKKCRCGECRTAWAVYFKQKGYSHGRIVK